MPVGWRLHENKYEHRAEYHDHVNEHLYVVMCSGMQNKGSEVISSGEKVHTAWHFLYKRDGSNWFIFVS